MTTYIMDVTFQFESDMTEKEITKIKRKKGDILTSDKITLTEFEETRIVEVVRGDKIPVKTVTAQDWELSGGTEALWDNLELDTEEPYEEYILDDETLKKLNAWIDFSMDKETKDKTLEDLWEEFKASYKA